MTVGLATTTFANKMADHVGGGTAFPQPPARYVKLHIGDPGASASANAAAVTTRSAATFTAASSGAIALTGTKPSWSMTTTETISHVSVWDASTAGNLLWTAALSSSRAVINTDTLTLDVLGLAFAPLAA